MVKIIRNSEDIEKGMAALLLIDPRLETISRMAGQIPLRLSEPGFTGLAHVIVSQVVSRASADAIWRRMTDGMGEVTAQNYLAKAPSDSPGFGLSRAKARTLHTVSMAIVEGQLDLNAVNVLCDEEAHRVLTSLSGVGPWTAQVYLMFCGGHADIFPSGDVALQAAVAHALKLEARPDSKALAEIALFWSPWRSVAARLFWAYYASIMQRSVLPVA